VHWENMTEADATWEYAAFIQATFPSFKPWRLVLRGSSARIPTWRSVMFQRSSVFPVLTQRFSLLLELPFYPLASFCQSFRSKGLNVICLSLHFNIKGRWGGREDQAIETQIYPCSCFLT
jgi:hypothetical protein